MNTEDYCSYEVAKLLKEKGFDWMCNGYYNKDDEDSEPYFGDGEGADNWNDQAPSVRDLWFSAPTHQMTMKFLREKYKIDIFISTDYPIDRMKYTYKIVRVCKDGDKYIDVMVGNYETYEEAVEAALKYSLKNLI